MLTAPSSALWCSFGRVLVCLLGMGVLAAAVMAVESMVRMKKKDRAASIGSHRGFITASGWTDAWEKIDKRAPVYCLE